MQRKGVGLFSVLLCLAGTLFLGQASAVPIIYNDPPLEPGVTRAGVNNQAAGNTNTPTGAEYFRFFANSGSNVTVFGDRLAGHYDMSFWVFSGLFADTNDFGGSFDASDAAFSDFGDDEDSPNIGGPFGDPRVSFLAPATGFYTVAVTNFLSGAGPPNPFELTATGIQAVPEPGTLALVAAALAGLGFTSRRRKR